MAGGGHRDATPPAKADKFSPDSSAGVERGISSAGRALRSHRRGQGFEFPILHFPEILTAFQGSRKIMNQSQLPKKALLLFLGRIAEDY